MLLSKNTNLSGKCLFVRIRSIGVPSAATSFALLLTLAALFSGSPVFGQGTDTEATSPFVLPRDLVEQSDATNPFRFAGFVVTPSRGSWPRYEDVLERHPTTESCLTEDARGGASLDLLAYDWMGINGRYAHDVCLFRVWTALGSPELVASWMSEFDLTVREVQYPPDSDGADRFGRNITGSWSWEDAISRSSLGGRGIRRFFDEVLFQPTLTLTARFMPGGGGLDRAAVGYIRQ